MMTAPVTELQPWREALLSCSLCGHTWTGVYHDALPWWQLECPSCGRKGIALVHDSDPLPNSTRRPRWFTDRRELAKVLAWIAVGFLLPALLGHFLMR